MTSMNATVDSLYRYPVKGFSPGPLAGARLARHATIPGDRVYAIENGPSGFDPSAPAYQPKTKFLCLMKNARLAKLRTTLDPETHDWHVEGDRAATFRLSTEEGRRAAEAYLTDFMGEEVRGPLKVLAAPGHSFSDVGKPLVSIINLATVAALGLALGRSVDPLRFRANVYVTGLPPFVELDWVGRRAALGTAEIAIVKRTRRCVATNVDPATAERDMEIPANLLRLYDHMDCGVYAEVRAGGILNVGDPLILS
ncbi:MOSC domain-containing protein [Kaistia geumhonensis]|uniref:Uncharacterized protein YcbX n=1 Tax=Kaistia geumhonensis TaxID=410839 RepID=A0ABU0M3A7_9HYPH|nr:MOSC domain-containing protein [Kaistia geumhonensis]MCX5479341.1 MOSC domain-containing protein [Kaistia geumhonensis]MDQ0515436.1 uncharacterized protein YcbX [Kaistia geumhonensis]